MTRIYKPRPKTERPCACGCGRKVVGRSDKRYYNQACRKRVLRQHRLP